MKPGDWYNAKLVEDTVDSLSETAGSLGYAFANVQPDFARNKDDLTMGINFRIAEAPRVYVERVDVNGNTLTQDKVIRREFRLAEGDAFNSYQIKRSSNRIKSLGYFQEKFEVEQKPGSTPDRIALEANVEEKPTGELQLSAGFSSLESFIFQASIQQNNFRGRGQTIGLSVDYSYYSRSVQVSFTEPYLFDKNVSLGVDVYRRDYNSFNYLNSNRNTTYKQTTTGFQVRAGVPLTEYMSLIGRYTFNIDDVSLDEATYYLNGECSPLLAGRYLCDAIGHRTSSIFGPRWSMTRSTTACTRPRAPRGRSAATSPAWAVRCVCPHHRQCGASGRWARASCSACAARAARSRAGQPLHRSDHRRRAPDRPLLPGPAPDARLRHSRGGPARAAQVLLRNSDGTFGAITTDRNSWSDDALGGKYYYIGHAELEIPLGAGAAKWACVPRSSWMPVRLGRDQAATSTGVVLYTDALTGKITTAANASDGTANSTYQKYDEVYVGNSPQPRISIGIGVNWNSPFGPFRIDFAKVLKKVDGDDTQPITFNVGTQF
jgi:outer membrane protein insertion porin family